MPGSARSAAGGNGGAMWGIALGAGNAGTQRFPQCQRALPLCVMHRKCELARHLQTPRQFTRGGCLFLFESPPEAIFHPGRESAAELAVTLRLSGTRPLGAARVPPVADSGRALLLPSTEKEQNACPEHENEAEQADYREASRFDRKRNTRDQQHQAQYEQGRRLQTTLARSRPQAAAPHTGGKFRILSIERALDLIEHALLVLGEWHGPSSPGT